MLNSKKKGIKCTCETKKLISNRSVKYYSGIGVIKCDGVKPIRLQNFTIQEGMYSSDKRFSITLAELENAKSLFLLGVQRIYSSFGFLLQQQIIQYCSSLDSVKGPLAFSRGR